MAHGNEIEVKVNYNLNELADALEAVANALVSAADAFDAAAERLRESN